MIRVLSTSTGDPTIVVTKPAPRAAVKCRGRPSFMSFLLSSSILMVSYAASSDEHMMELRTMFGPTPVHSLKKPSSTTIRRYASMLPVYLGGAPGGLRASACSLILTRSVGLATSIPMAPLVRPARMRCIRVGGPDWPPQYRSRIGAYKLILKVAKTSCRCTPALRPFHGANTPSRLTRLWSVGKTPTLSPLVICMATLMVSIGSVTNSADAPAAPEHIADFMKLMSEFMATSGTPLHCWVTLHRCDPHQQPK
mmetsp:Transcript_14007/g.33371  ORF Transcript_14007/g.33371 Transcript_14007/m.33371 type:complete len:253 (-) Transcript_14007:129-887(-)